jgi:hypothetical protein
MSTLKVSSIQNPSTASGGVSIDTSGHVTVDGVAMPSEGPLSGTRNRIINGDMRIDQRNAGASVTQTTAVNFVTDRFSCAGSITSKFTAQRSTVAPAGFTNSLGVTSSSAYSVGSSEYFILRHIVEGFNCADFAWGTADAKTVVLSFKVRSSLTGTFGGSLFNSAVNRNYAFSYTISAANTWTDISIPIAGDTSGTWLADNGAGLYINWSMGTGSTYSLTPGSWGASTAFSATGATSVVGTNGATFYITGVQLEAGSVATPFEHRSYGQELALCQRYYWKNGGYASYLFVASGFATSSTACELYVAFPVEMRTQPDADRSGLRIRGNGVTPAVTGIVSNYASRLSSDLSLSVASGLSAGLAVCAQINGSATDYLSFSAEL